MNFFVSTAVIASSLVGPQAVIEKDTKFNTAHPTLLANELFDRGELFAEDLGYDFVDVDPMTFNSPNSISYATGIEGYEYSRYLLNTLSGRSGMGLHMMWSPIVKANAAMQPDSFDSMFTGGVVESMVVRGHTQAVDIYNRVFKHVFNGMALSEAVPKGENGDGIPSIAGGIKPFIFAAQGTYLMKHSGISAASHVLHRIYPNPVNDILFIEMYLDKSAINDISLYDAKSAFAIQSPNYHIAPGRQEHSISVDNLMPGAYFLELSVDHELVAIEKVMLY